MRRVEYKLAAALSLSVLSTSVLSMEKLSDEQLSNVQAKGTYNFAFDNIEFHGAAADGAEAGSINSVATDGSSLGLTQFQFSANHIGTLTAPLTTGTSVSDASVNGSPLGEQTYLRIGLSELTAWSNVDIVFTALFGNPTEPDPLNPDVTAGVAPSANLELGQVTVDNLALAGHIEIAGIPEGYKIVSQSRSDEGNLLLLDGRESGGSRQGLLLNINLDELKIDQILLEPGQGTGYFDDSRDLVIRDFSLKNLQMTSATVETTASGWRFAYSDPQAFTGGQGETLPPGVSGHPSSNDTSFPQASLSFETQITQSLPSQSSIQGVTLDHLVFNLRTD